jgi:heterodisulfide reductase subunit A
MTEVGLHPYIELLTYSEVEEVSGSIGNFKVKVRKKARSVDEKKCIGCDECEVKCPWKVPSEFEMGLGKRGAIYIPSAVAVPNIPVIDKDICAYFRKGTCRFCEKVCEAGAIDFNQQDQILELEVGSIIVATGFDLFDPSVIEEYGYGKYENVYIALHFERFTCAGGATRGKIQLRDGREPKSVAIVHCIGSRDVNYYPYCSRVCCMYGLKYAYLCKEFIKDVEVYNIYIDMRTFGEAQEEFYQRVSDMGVNFIRGRVGRITEDPETKKLTVHCSDTLLGKMLDIPVDMVILNPAMTPCKDAEKVASIFNLSQRGDGFFLETHMKLAPVETPTSGVFIAGCCAGPKDIPDTVAQASAAAGKCLSLISKGRVPIDAAIAHVDETRCQGCGQCEETCTFSAPKVISKNGVMVSEVNEALCKGCGACAVVCPTGAISIRHYHKYQVLSMIEAFTETA